MIYLVNWDYDSESYLYGSVITHRQGIVHFKNAMIPPGFTLMRWVSSCNYQAARHEPELPPLKEGRTYHLHVFAETVPADRIILQLIFQDSLRRRIDVKNYEGTEIVFTCPADCCRWEIELRNGGFSEISFSRMELMEQQAWEKPWMGVRALPAAKNVLLLESTGSCFIRCPSDDYLGKIPFLAAIPAVSFANALEEKKMTALLSKEAGRFIGYGPQGNTAAVKLTRLPGWSACVSSRGLSEPQKRLRGVYVYNEEKETLRYPLLAELCDCRETLYRMPKEVLTEWE